MGGVGDARGLFTFAGCAKLKLSGAASASSDTHGGDAVVPRFWNSASFVKTERLPARLPIMRASSGKSSGKCSALVTR